jgi:hypothetical protein
VIEVDIKQRVRAAWASPERTVARSYLVLFYRNNRLYQVEGNAFVAGGQAEVEAMRFQ